MTAKTQVCKIFLKVHPSKWEKAFEKLSHISFVTRASTENPK